MKEIKIYKQETDKSCGVACLRSIINYYGNNYSEKEIWDKHNFWGEGDKIMNPVISLGVTALKFGFDVTYIGYNPTIANNNNKDNLEESLKEKLKTYFSFGKYIIEQASEFLRLGGQLVIDKLNIDKLKKIIDNDKFFLVEIKPAFITQKGLVNMNHKVIVDGYTQEGFKILNPNGKKEIYKFDDFLLAFYAAVPEILIIKKKRGK